MIKFVLPIFFLCFLCSISSGQTDKRNKKLEKETKEGLHEWAQNPTLDTDTLNPQILEELKDSGQLVNNIKEALWIEYSLDSSLVGTQATLNVGEKSLPMDLGFSL